MKRFSSIILSLVLAVMLPWLTGCASGGGGIGGTGGMLGQGGGIGGTGNLIGQSGGGIGGTGRDASDIFRFTPAGIGQGAALPASDGVAPSPSPQQVAQLPTPTAPTTSNRPVVNANDVAIPQVATSRDVEPGAGAPALEVDGLNADAPPPEGLVPDAMIDQPPGMMNCPDIMLMDPNCAAPIP